MDGQQERGTEEGGDEAVFTELYAGYRARLYLVVLGTWNDMEFAAIAPGAVGGVAATDSGRRPSRRFATRRFEPRGSIVDTATD